MASVSVRVANPLQWGHRLSAMEMHPVGLKGQLRHHASMGPPPFGDGDDHETVFGQGDLVALQWGHRLSAMEIGDSVTMGAISFLLLQWGHRLSAMEILA